MLRLNTSQQDHVSMCGTKFTAVVELLAACMYTCIVDLRPYQYYILCIILACVLGTKFSTTFTAVVDLMGTCAAAKVLNLVPWKASYEYRHEWLQYLQRHGMLFVCTWVANTKTKQYLLNLVGTSSTTEYGGMYVGGVLYYQYSCDNRYVHMIQSANSVTCDAHVGP